MSRCWLGRKIAFAGDFTYVYTIKHHKAYRLTFSDWCLMQNEVYWIPTFNFFFGIPNFGIGIPISRFFNSGIRKKKCDHNLWNQKRNQNSASDGGPRNWNQNSEFPTKKFNAAVGPTNPKIQQQLATKMQIKYKGDVGELIWAMMTCRPNSAFTSIKLSQSNSSLAEHHYHGLKQAIWYRYITHNDGIYFWRTNPQNELLKGSLQTVTSNVHDLLIDNGPVHDAQTAVAYGDSDWASCVKTRQSFSSTCIQLSEGRIAYKTKFQPTIALSPTEAEFMAACNMARMCQIVHSLLWDLDIPQEAATVAYEDNNGCTAMGNAQQPTTRTCHINIKYFALCDWMERDLIVFECIDMSIKQTTSLNLWHKFSSLSRRLFVRSYPTKIFTNISTSHHHIWWPLKGYWPIHPRKFCYTQHCLCCMDFCSKYWWCKRSSVADYSLAFFGMSVPIHNYIIDCGGVLV